MKFKLILLKSGELIITEIEEMVIGEDETEKTIGYFFNKPCLVNMSKPSISTSDDTTTKFKIILAPWIALAKDGLIPVPLDWVVTMVDPVDQLSDMYINDVINYKKKNDQTTSVTEQPDSGISD